MICENCGGGGAERYEQSFFSDAGVPREITRLTLCAACARERRRNLPVQPGIPRTAWIAALDRFFADSGVLDICRRCHQQGTGCCPPTCRRLEEEGCGSKMVWCSGFVCSALLLAISECDPETARLLRWARREAGESEYRLYEIMVRVPSAHREPVRMLDVARHLPPLELDGKVIRSQLSSLAEEVLAMRRQWSEEDGTCRENLRLHQ